MDPPTFKPPTRPLQPSSPDRINQRLSSPTHNSTSPTRNQNSSPSRHSDVQSKVAFLNSLTRASSNASIEHAPLLTSPSASPTRDAGSRLSTTAALQRAILGREEAECMLRDAQEELEEGRIKERKMQERMESMLEDLRNAKERSAHERAVFEKEVRRVRKEAFKAGSALVKVQEELKTEREFGRVIKEDLKAEKEARKKAEQEAFERAYAIAGLSEELEVLKKKVEADEADTKVRALREKRKAVEEEVDVLAKEAETPTPTPKKLRLSETPASLQASISFANAMTPGGNLDFNAAGRLMALAELESVKRRLTTEIQANETDLTAPKEDDWQYTKDVNPIAWLREELRVQAEEKQRLSRSLRLMEEERRASSTSSLTSCSCGSRKSEIVAEDSKRASPAEKLPSRSASAQSQSRPKTPVLVEEPSEIKQEKSIDSTMLENEDTEHENDKVFSPVSGTFRTRGAPSPVKQKEMEEALHARIQAASASLQGLADQSSPNGGEKNSQMLRVRNESEAAQRQNIMNGSMFRTPSSRSINAASHSHPYPGQTALTASHSANENENEHENDYPSIHKTITTTTSIPLALDTPVSNRSRPTSTLPGTPIAKFNPSLDLGANANGKCLPGTPVTREQALEQIRARRGRARSAHGNGGRSVSGPLRVGGNGSASTTSNGSARASENGSGSGGEEKRGRDGWRDISAPAKY